MRGATGPPEQGRGRSLLEEGTEPGAPIGGPFVEELSVNRDGDGDPDGALILDLPGYRERLRRNGVLAQMAEAHALLEAALRGQANIDTALIDAFLLLNSAHGELLRAPIERPDARVSG
jgi:hypothetical protein